MDHNNFWKVLANDPVALKRAWESITYNVYRSPGCSATFALLNTIPISATSFLDIAVPPGA
jgi:hypothetical protein